MMNEARLGVGMNATAIATAAFQTSLEYAKVRPEANARPSCLHSSFDDVLDGCAFSEDVFNKTPAHGTLEVNGVRATVSVDLNTHAFREGIHNARADAVQTTGHLVAFAAELSASMQLGHH